MLDIISFRKCLSIVLSFFLMGVILIPSTISVEIQKSPISAFCDGNTLYVGGTGPNNYTKIQDAIDNSSNGDTVFVYDDSSPYQGNISIAKSINLIGENRNTTIIDGIGKNTVVRITCDFVKVENFNITNGGNAIVLIYANNCIISKNNFIDSLWKGIYGTRSHNNLIIDNYFLGPDEKFCYGIDIHYGDNNNITGNQITDIRHYPIGFSSGSNNIVFKNEVNSYSSRYGISLKGSLNAVLFNTINTYGTYPEVPYNYIKIQGDFNNIENNNLIAYHQGSDVGIYVEGENNLISKNLISSINGYAIDLISYFSSYNTVSYNNIINNSRGIWITGGNFNQIIYNNFQNNGHNAFFYLFSFFNTWDGNYWDGSRIVPYPITGRLFLSIIPWIQFDWRPAQEPYDIGV